MLKIYKLVIISKKEKKSSLHLIKCFRLIESSSCNFTDIVHANNIHSN